MLYSKNGSIPKPETDGTEGWIEVPDAPVASEGKEVVWWFPPGWIIRDPKPEQSIQTFNTYDNNGNVVSTEQKLADWSWQQVTQEWKPYPLITAETTSISQNDELSALVTSNDSITLSSSGEPT